MENPINNTVFDTRDLIDYLKELEDNLVNNWNDFRAEFAETAEEPQFTTDEFKADYIEDIFGTAGFEYADNAKTLFDSFQYAYENEILDYNDLNTFCDELRDCCSDFNYGASIIHEDYFTDYTQELVTDCGYISSDFPGWIEIDWEATANNVKNDYSEVTYNGNTYFIR
jgi:hypothetical protein